MLNYAEARDHLSVVAKLTQDDPFLVYLLKMAVKHCQERDKEDQDRKRHAIRRKVIGEYRAL